MFPGVNPRQMQKMMKQMGIQQDALDVSRVEMFLPGGEKLVFDDPEVAKVNMMGQEMYQVTGEAHTESTDATPEISAEDIKTVMDQTGVNEEKARAAIEDAKGDLAEAIVNLSE